MSRQCARPGCSAIATATFTFDSRRCVVWLDPVSTATARAGDLCERHARRLAPPRGWRVEDRTRPGAERPAPAAVEPVVEVLAVPAGATRGADARWQPRFDPGDDLGGLLDARSPLLGRAFRNMRGV